VHNNEGVPCAMYNRLMRVFNVLINEYVQCALMRVSNVLNNEGVQCAY
jgi:hypothetical protein